MSPPGASPPKKPQQVGVAPAGQLPPLGTSFLSVHSHRAPCVSLAISDLMLCRDLGGRAPVGEGRQIPRALVVASGGGDVWQEGQVLLSVSRGLSLSAPGAWHLAGPIWECIESPVLLNTAGRLCP